MTEPQDFHTALEAFLASDTFGIVVHNNLAQQPLVPHVVALTHNGSFTVFSCRADGSTAAEKLVLDIPSGSEVIVSAALRQMLVEHPRNHAATTAGIASPYNMRQDLPRRQLGPR